MKLIQLFKNRDAMMDNYAIFYFMYNKMRGYLNIKLIKTSISVKGGEGWISYCKKL